MRPPARVHRDVPGARQWAAALLLAALTRVGPAPAATLVITVQSPDGHALAGAVVTARPLGAPGKRPAPVHAVMDQVDRAFAPDLLVVPIGSTVEFPNSDSVSHQIYSFSQPKRFKLPLYRGKPYPPVPFDQAGVVTLGCNIHDDMLAYLLVTDAPWFGRTDKSGAWVADVPRGRYRVSIWHPRMRETQADLERELTVGDADRAELTVHLGKSLLPAPISDRPHSWDY
ncbi:MAG: methylamine utilization protein [Bacillati bacterium ANGP1]|uniref:Methylamine utilization protein n=1 Tax=Candidatus Segetimicrobium genomatis TaxID=2569760 RepID=A0A537K6Z1_9BACT|nr:MAG: methylamine utilization protein [Terrabacteria group bacterium ANGP1]